MDRAVQQRLFLVRKGAPDVLLVVGAVRQAEPLAEVRWDGGAGEDGSGSVVVPAKAVPRRSSPTSIGATRNTGACSGPSTQATCPSGSSRTSFSSSTRSEAAFWARRPRPPAPNCARPHRRPFRHRGSRPTGSVRPLPARRWSPSPPPGRPAYRGRPALRNSSSNRLARSLSKPSVRATSSSRGRSRGWSRSRP